jgi:hypothetical protein
MANKSTTKRKYTMRKKIKETKNIASEIKQEAGGVNPLPNITVHKMEILQDNNKPELIDKIQFFNRTNVLELRYTKLANRSYKIQIFMNDLEIRPHTYVGNSAGMSYWNMLKMCIK